MRILQLIAPSGYPQDQDAVARAVDYFTQHGWLVRGHSAALRHFQRFAGTDTERLAELNALTQLAQEGHKPELVMALRGGYGMSRLLDGIDFEALAQADLRFMGHSDFTAFSLAYYAKVGKPSYLGPMACFDFGSEQPSTFMEHHFWCLLDEGQDLIEVQAAQPQTFETEGVLWGGNLTMVNQLVGTPYLPKVTGGILFLEDINEHPYRIERNLYQLRDAGILEQQSAVILGQFNGFKLYDNDHGYDYNEMVAHMRSRCRVPILTDLSFGHVRDKVTLPVGQKAKLCVAGEAGYRLEVRAI
ncbi:LD-carboxypeptidase [Hydromonas duriensis]|uniref:Murein tetrapeptidase LD-carboxypeptidase n=1 Tax=Hydromonas duriensis TaxID=1527608 RepID=A0A4R6YA49_9BURK|nr:LD-carboxypeptidase [Hydromonas duriensis]TDR32347.1 murein tetrapeptidase LD-carboxypeptidase [Hydromonas duriensis]